MRCHSVRLGIAVNMVIGLLALPIAQADPLNDTGIDFCRDLTTKADTAVTYGTTCQPLPIHGAQDARYGRDAAAIKRILPKVGGSAGTESGNPNGFDFTKISNSGGVLPANATLDSGPEDWVCTYDNVTGLLWEVKVDNPAHLRHMGHTYTWYDSTHGYEEPGTPDTIGLSGLARIPAVCQVDGRCDTEKFVADVNATGLCGHTDWRMPTIKELQSIVDYDRVDPAIDPVYFPNTQSGGYWSSTPYAGSFPYPSDTPHSWVADFYFGYATAASTDSGGKYSNRFYASYVRLVRTGQ